MGTCCSTPQPRSSSHHHKPLVRMCSSGNHFPDFADIGDTVVLFVDFGTDCKPVTRSNLSQALGEATAAWESPVLPLFEDKDEDQYEIKLAGLPTFLRKIRPGDKSCTSFRAQAKLLLPNDVLGNPSGLVKFVVPYCNKDGKFGVVTEQDEDQYNVNHRVYNHALWDELIVHNEEIRDEIRHRTYGGRLHDSGGPSTSVDMLTTNDDEDPAPKIHPAERYWPDTWQMARWQTCCDPIMRPTNCFTRFLAMFLVAPLTNVTGLSLYYQLYLLEIFHLRFLTKFGHYLCMPFIVMMMLTFFAQWRFQGCYTQGNIEVFVPNGSVVLALILWFWYTLWGLIQNTPLMGFFTIVPMTVLYILGNITFQMSIENSSPHPLNCTQCWDFTYQSSDHVKFFNAFKLIHWYFNPVLWAFVLSFLQAFSHIFEPKIPPRVDGTQHWMSCGDMLKRYGEPKTIAILMAQSLFGTVDEFLASPRLLPLLILRIFFTLGYNPKEWKVLNILVDKSLQYGDPAIDYIGTGGSEYLPAHKIKPAPHRLTDFTDTDGADFLFVNSIIPVASISTIDITGEKLEAYSNTGYNIGKLKRNLQEMESILTDRHYRLLRHPQTLQDSTDEWLKHYILVRHHVAKYELQVHAYGPFRTQNNDQLVHYDNERMERDFPLKQHKAFRNFLKEVRFHLWMTEDDLIANRARGFSPYCRKEL
ncbi:uncharacterized protein LOC144650355 isoform X2 [Oculina patagonica]